MTFIVQLRQPTWVLSLQNLGDHQTSFNYGHVESLVTSSFIFKHDESYYLQPCVKRSETASHFLNPPFFFRTQWSWSTVTTLSIVFNVAWHFYVTLVTFPMTLLSTKFTSIVIDDSNLDEIHADHWSKVWYFLHYHKWLKFGWKTYY